jgi:hypothetical protein
MSEDAVVPANPVPQWMADGRSTSVSDAFGPPPLRYKFSRHTATRWIDLSVAVDRFVLARETWGVR